MLPMYQELPRRLPTLTGLKLILLFLIFLWHAPIQKAGWPDLGARCCELFFVISGFLVAYNHHNQLESSNGHNLTYYFKKLAQSYPAYLFSLALSILWLFLTQEEAWLKSDYLIGLPFHLLLIQSWIPNIALNYNGAAWFLSSLLFCYAASPYISVTLKCLMRAFGNVRGIITLFLASTALRLLIDLGVSVDPITYNINTHIFPIVRLLEFAMSYAAGVAFLSLHRNRFVSPLAGNCLLGSLMEIATLLLTTVIVVRYSTILPRSAFVLLFVIAVFILAAGYGALNKLMSLSAFSNISHFELEFYLFHQPIIRILIAVLAIFGITWERKTALLAFIFTVVLCVGFRSLLNASKKVVQVVHDKAH